MLNHIWAAMLIIGFLYGTLTGNLHVMTDSMLSAAKDAVDLSITLLGIVAFWCGIMEIAQEAGLIEILSRKMQPLIHFIFPDVPEEHEALKAISLNFIANILGLGWAATPAGLKAMEELEKLEEERRSVDNCKCGTPSDVMSTRKSRPKSRNIGIVPKNVASNEMCTFLILNISSLQLIPVNVIAYRNQYGSVNPAAIVGPGILATAVSTAVAVAFCKVMDHRKRKV